MIQLIHESERVKYPSWYISACVENDILGSYLSDEMAMLVHKTMAKSFSSFA